jgi:hypothetical protein
MTSNVPSLRRKNELTMVFTSVSQSLTLNDGCSSRPLADGPTPKNVYRTNAIVFVIYQFSPSTVSVSINAFLKHQHQVAKLRLSYPRFTEIWVRSLDTYYATSLVGRLFRGFIFGI